jgi:SAM-dependent methyltransferase
MAEIGVAYGYHAEQILGAIPAVHYVGIDPFIPGYDPQDSFAKDVEKIFRDTPTHAMNRLWLCVLIKLTFRYGERASLLRLTSKSAADLFDDGYFDLIYIDGDHTFDGVAKDLAAWFPKVRPGGVFCGDDYDWDGVKGAVNKFAAERGLRLDPCPAKKWKILLPQSKT